MLYEHCPVQCSEAQFNKFNDSHSHRIIRRRTKHEFEKGRLNGPRINKSKEEHSKLYLNKQKTLGIQIV
jgi:hypothetical protein